MGMYFCSLFYLLGTVLVLLLFCAQESRNDCDCFQYPSIALFLLSLENGIMLPISLSFSNFNLFFFFFLFTGSH